MKILYAVPWIEVDYGWGDRPEGFKIFDDKDECIRSTKKSSLKGNYEDGSGYFGPARPLRYYETPDEVEGPFPAWKNKLEFKSTSKEIK